MTPADEPTPRTEAAEDAYRDWCILADKLQEKAPIPPDGGWDFARTIERELNASLRRLREREWVPVGERLPDEYVCVLIGRLDIPTFAGAIIAFRVGDKWYTDVMKPALYATHWMPLPPAPKERT